MLRVKAGEANRLIPPSKGWQFLDGKIWQSNLLLECNRDTLQIIEKWAKQAEEKKELKNLAIQLDAAVEAGDCDRMQEIQQLKADGRSSSY